MSRPGDRHESDATGAVATPALCRWPATRRARSSRQGAAISCTPIGSCGWQPQTGTAQTGRPMNEIGCVSRPRLGRAGRRRPPIVSHSVPIAGATRRRRRRDQHVDLAEQLGRAQREPAAQALRLQHPGGRQQRAGEEAVARQRLEVGGAAAQVGQVQGAALGVGDQEGGGARPRGLGQRARCGSAPSAAATALHRGARLGTGLVLEVAAERWRCAGRRCPGRALRRSAPGRAARRPGRAGRVPAARRRRGRGRARSRANGPRWSRLATNG